MASWRLVIVVASAAVAIATAAACNNGQAELAKLKMDVWELERELESYERSIEALKVDLCERIVLGAVKSEFRIQLGTEHEWGTNEKADELIYLWGGDFYKKCMNYETFGSEQWHLPMTTRQSVWE